MVEHWLLAMMVDLRAEVGTKRMDVFTTAGNALMAESWPACIFGKTADVMPAPATFVCRREAASIRQ